MFIMKNLIFRQVVVIFCSFFLNSTFASELKSFNIYMVDYPPFYSSKTNSGLGPSFIKEINSELRGSAIFNIKSLPAKRLIHQFLNKEIRIIFYSPTHLPLVNKKMIRMLPFVKLIEKYVGLADVNVTKEKPVLAYYRGDERERLKSKKDEFIRIPISDPSSLYSMLMSKRVDLINCLLPYCKYMEKKHSNKLIYYTKSVSENVDFGGFLVNKGNINAPDIMLLHGAVKAVYNSGKYKKLLMSAARQLGISYTDLALNKEQLFYFIEP